MATHNAFISEYPEGVWAAAMKAAARVCQAKLMS
jgi:hypothetical protein